MFAFRRAVLKVLVPITLVAVLGAASVLWLDQQGARTRLAEAQLQPALARGDAAEARAVRAEASLTAIAQQRVAEVYATATAVATSNMPQRALERALGRMFAVQQEPLGRGYEQLSEVYSPAALQKLRNEADYLRGTGQHLGGASTFSVDASSPQEIAPDRAAVHTTERWVYDERDESDRRQRCFIEDSDQTYVMRLSGQTWVVDEVQLGDSRRSQCPPGT
jgi:hypothetical protein